MTSGGGSGVCLGHWVFVRGICSRRISLLAATNEPGRASGVGVKPRTKKGEKGARLERAWSDYQANTHSPGSWEWGLDVYK